MTTKKDPQSVDTGGGVYIGGSVDTGGGTFVGRDQTITSQHGASLEEFTALVAELRGMLSQAGLESDIAEAIDAEFEVVEQQAAKETPNGAFIKSKLKSISDGIASAGGTAAAVEKILSLLSKASTFAGTLFS